MKKQSLALILLFTFILAGSDELLAKKEKKDSKNIVAKVGEKEITTAELDEASKDEMQALATQIYQIKKRKLDEMISQALYEQEAKAEKKSVAEIQKGLGASDVTVSEDAIEVFYDANRTQFGGKTLEEARSQIRQMLIAQKTNKAMSQALDELKKKHPVQIFLEEPKVVVETQGRPSRGPENAKVTIVEFSDFQCPFCKKFTETIDQIVKNFPNDVRHVYRHLPLSFHQQAHGAAKASHCADKQGKFWEFRDLAFKNSSVLDEPSLRKYAEQIGLDLKMYDVCVADPASDQYIKDDLAYAAKVGARGTPTSFINGVLYSGARPYEELKNIIEQKIKGN